tara:strand:- start:2452 stop:2607 length:156 start_codon:yes stop_codon:yes gene_type:complete
MAELFGVGGPVISKHLKTIFESGELWENGLFPFWKMPLNSARQRALPKPGR